MAIQPKKNLAVNADLVDRLTDLASNLDCPREDLVNQAIDQFLEVQAWQLDTSLTNTRSRAATR